MNKHKCLALCAVACLLLTACAPVSQEADTTVPPYVQEDLTTMEVSESATKIDLSIGSHTQNNQRLDKALVTR